MAEGVNQWKVYRHRFPIECMNPQEKMLRRQIKDILKIAHRIERLTQDTNAKNDGEVSDKSIAQSQKMHTANHPSMPQSAII